MKLKEEFKQNKFCSRTLHFFLRKGSWYSWINLGEIMSFYICAWREWNYLINIYKVNGIFPKIWLFIFKQFALKWRKTKYKPKRSSKGEDFFPLSKASYGLTYVNHDSLSTNFWCSTFLWTSFTASRGYFDKFSRKSLNSLKLKLFYNI